MESDRHAKAILFDYDGVLADTLPFVLKRWTATARLFGNGIEVTRDLVSVSPTGAWQTFYTEILGVSEEKLEVASKLFLDLAKKDGMPPLYNGVKEAVERLSRDYDLYILSSNYSEIIQATLVWYGLQKNIRGIIGHEDVGAERKTDPRFMLSSLERWHLEKEDVVYIGDTQDEVVGARRAGIKIIACSWGYQSRQSLEEARPDMLIDEPRQIQQAVAHVFKEKQQSVPR